ncbi:hypothetical protein [Halomicrobium salinisoli]|uniref:hypothetical protein n=1 Tax=Halomicrobium salinisoli TaxID=2878391 RepID=UPI001CF07C6C|nr:hypothetical protein [Halomicrobium salinisoli]
MPDISTIDTVVVTAEELVAALESRERDREPTALRVTAPFSGRMRARLHVEQGDETGDPSQLLLRPDRLVDGDCPSPPHPDDTADAIRADPDDDYSVERHRERHRQAMREWRDRVADHAVERVPVGDHAVALVVLDAAGPDPDGEH